MPVKTVPRPKARTLDEALIYMTEKMAETDARIAKSNEWTDRRIAEMSQRIKESNELTDRKIRESQEKTEQAIRDFIVESNKIIDRLSDNIGNVGNRLGDIVELIVIPGVRKAINALGHNFKRSYPNKRISGRKGQIAEIDLLLTNGAEAMAVEIKSGLSANYVDAFLIKLKKLRKFETEANLQGKKLYGAMVGVYVDERARKLALKNGLYVIEILEEEKKLKTDKPTKCRVW